MEDNFRRISLTEAGVAVLDCEHKTPQGAMEGFPYIAIPDIQDGRVVLETTRKISETDLHEWTRRNAPRSGDIIVTRRGRVGDSAPIPSGLSCAIGQNLVLLRSDNSCVNQTFLKWAVRSPQWWNEVDRLTNVGAVFNSLNVRDIGKIRLDIPDPFTQRAIVEVLEALDDKIAANTKLAETSSQLAQSIFAAAATNTEGVKVGLSESSHLLSRGITPKYSEDEDTMTILNQKCVRDQRVNLTPARRTDLAKVREEKILSQNDVLVNSTGQGTLGRVARWTHDKRVTVDSHITIIRFNPEEVDPVCAGFAVLRSEREITDMAEGSTGQTELSRIELGKLKILLPPREQQQELGQRLAKMAAMENAYLQENERLAATRDALLPQLMSGKLRVKDAEKVLDESL